MARIEVFLQSLDLASPHYRRHESCFYEDVLADYDLFIAGGDGEARTWPGNVGSIVITLEKKKSLSSCV